jgi:hypothetical protein
MSQNIDPSFNESPEAKAIRLLNRQLGELQQTIRSLNNTDNPRFKAWRDTTRGVIERFLGKENHHTMRFVSTRFFTMTTIGYGEYAPPPGYVSPEDLRAYQEGSATAEQTLKAAIQEIEDFGVHVEEPKPSTGKGRSRSGGISQNFHGPTQINQAIATDSAVQRIGRVGNQTGADLKELSNLIQQSQDLSPNQVRQAVADVEALAVEVEKPEEKRNWKAVLDTSQKILDVAAKAADLAAKLAPYTPTVVALVENARHFIK